MFRRYTPDFAGEILARIDKEKNQPLLPKSGKTRREEGIQVAHYSDADPNLRKAVKGDGGGDGQIVELKDYRLNKGKTKPEKVKGNPQFSQEIEPVSARAFRGREKARRRPAHGGKTPKYKTDVGLPLHRKEKMSF